MWFNFIINSHIIKCAFIHCIYCIKTIIYFFQNFYKSKMKFLIFLISFVCIFSLVFAQKRKLVNIIWFIITICAILTVPNECHGINEVFEVCGPACGELTCATRHLPRPFCDSICISGCFCKPGYIRQAVGFVAGLSMPCVPISSCA